MPVTGPSARALVMRLLIVALFIDKDLQYNVGCGII
jgi:hypothetical protein